MNSFWAKTWRSPLRAGLAGVLISAVIASILYGFNWHTFYDTRTNFARVRADLVAMDIENLALITNASPGGDERFRKAVKSYSAKRWQRITVSRISKNGTERVEWEDSNGVVVDEGRRPVVSEYELEQGKASDNSSSLHVSFKVGVRPPYLVALFRAWSFSLLDYIENPEQYMEYHLYNRSMPLYGYLLTILIVGFGTIRAFYRDQHELIRLEQEAHEITAELEQLGELHSDEINNLNQTIRHAEQQRDDVMQNRDLLVEELAGIERESEQFIKEAQSFAGDDSRLQQAKNRKNQLEAALAGYNLKIEYYENEMTTTRAELDAAEQLLHEVEERREDMGVKLQDRNRKIRQLQQVVQKTQKEMRKMQSEKLRLGQSHLRDLREWEESQGFIEEQLSQWLKTDGRARVNFSKHSNVEWVEEQFLKIDSDFVNRYFTHVNNSEYERGRSRLIRVHSQSGDGTDNSGALFVTLDDVGRSLAMRFETTKDAPKPQYIGFVLALLLRSKCREFENIPIRMR